MRHRPAPGTGRGASGADGTGAAALPWRRGGLDRAAARPRAASGPADLRVPAGAVLAGGRAPARTAGDRRFWSLVADGDTGALAAELGVEPDAGLSRVVPVLHTWRARTARSTGAPAPRYGITWRPVPPGAGRRLSGTWLLVGDDCGLGTRLGALGAEVHHLPVPGPADREGLARLLAAAPRPEGVVSTLALHPPGEATGTDTDTGTGTHAGTHADGNGDGPTGTGPDAEEGARARTRAPAQTRVPFPGTAGRRRRLSRSFRRWGTPACRRRCGA
ncbi:hypothetical protein ACWV95_01845 [Streptomyces albus]